MFLAAPYILSPAQPPFLPSSLRRCGKSALLAHWGEAYQKDNPNDTIITHFTGSTVQSTDHAHLVWRIMVGLKEVRTGKSIHRINQQSCAKRRWFVCMHRRRCGCRLHTVGVHDENQPFNNRLTN